MKGHIGEQSQDKHRSLFLIAQGGWRQPEGDVGTHQMDKEKKPIGYQFDFWSAIAPTKKEKVWPAKRTPGRPPGLTVATSQDCELELHYATKSDTSDRISKADTAGTKVSL